MTRRKNLGDVVKRQRIILRLTQTELARRAGIRPSHIGYVESGQRQPSLRLLCRLTRILGIRGGRLFFLACPELTELLDPHSSRLRAKQCHRAWKNFVENKALLARYGVSSQELKVLSGVNLLGKVSGPRQFLFILAAIRCALGEKQLVI